MPNHITNRMTVIKGRYDLSNITTFNTVKPMPRWLKDADHDSIAMDVERMLGVVETYLSPRLTLPQLYDKYPTTQDRDAINQLMGFQIMYGATTWYQWSIKNWGTKWDMYDVTCNNNVLQFDTAWSTPMHWLESFAKTLPVDVVIKIEYASEDIGSNAGIIEISHKECIANPFSNNTDEAWELAINLKNMAGLCQKVDGKWIFVDEED